MNVNTESQLTVGVQGCTLDQLKRDTAEFQDKIGRRQTITLIVLAVLGGVGLVGSLVGGGFLLDFSKDLGGLVMAGGVVGSLALFFGGNMVSNRRISRTIENHFLYKWTFWDPRSAEDGEVKLRKKFTESQQVEVDRRKPGSYTFNSTSPETHLRQVLDQLANQEDFRADLAQYLNAKPQE